MDEMWAPWRMPYIQQSGPETGCIFCTAAAAHDDEETLVVHRAERCFVMMNRFPYNSGHLMVVPYQHSGQLDEIVPETGADLFRMTQVSARALSRVMNPGGFNVGINQGEVAGAGVVDHIHLHVVPRWNGDTNFMPVLADVKVIPELLSATASKLRPVFAELDPRQ